MNIKLLRLAIMSSLLIDSNSYRHTKTVNPPVPNGAKRWYFTNIGWCTDKKKKLEGYAPDFECVAISKGRARAKYNKWRATQPPKK